MDVQTLVAAMPGLSEAKATEYLPLMQTAMIERGITSELRSRMWLAQVGTESASLRYFEEIADGSAYNGRQDLGNTQLGDGPRFKGRGPIQITGRANYTAAAQALGLPLVEHPEMAAEPRYAFRVSAWWWEAHGLNQISDTGDVVAATRRINGGLNGLADRQARYERAKALGTRVVVGPAANPALSGGDEMFIKEKDGSVYWLIYQGAQSYWRGVPASLAKAVPAERIIDDPNGDWLRLWKVGAA